MWDSDSAAAVERRGTVVPLLLATRCFLGPDPRRLARRGVTFFRQGTMYSASATERRFGASASKVSVAPFNQGQEVVPPWVRLAL